MKNFILLVVLLITCSSGFSQTLAYPATFESYAYSDCIDLTSLNSIVQGHQLDFNVDYFSSLSDAQANSNKLPPFYSYGSFNETLYARVTNNLLSSDFAISEITISLSAVPCCPPPPPGYNTFTFCDTDQDGEEVAYLANLRYRTGIAYPPESFCDLEESQIIITYFTSLDDANNDTNPINEIYTFSETTEIYYKTSNTINSLSFILEFGIEIVACETMDTDNDGIDDADEDVNRNGYYFEDDTDNDGLKNFEDADDDNDGVLTINEDYNGNGDPTDDDTNGNSIPDYLEPTVTLSNGALQLNGFEILENPVKNLFKLDFNGYSYKKQLSIIDIHGKTVYDNSISETSLNLEVSFLPSGIYFVSAEIGGHNILKKFIKE